uniref:Uncharacterized protein n=1 Tax=Ciona intestinalis TaxID=7719 RepID=H2XR55_CIOIN
MTCPPPIMAGGTGRMGNIPPIPMGRTGIIGIIGIGPRGPIIIPLGGKVSVAIITEIFRHI